MLSLLFSIVVLCVVAVYVCVDGKGPAIFVIFGRPGSGKSTLSGMASQKLKDCATIDLDVCVTNEMKENFDKGIYPSHEERGNILYIMHPGYNQITFIIHSLLFIVQFMENACKYLEEKICSRKSSSTSCLVSFSFVNDDMRQVFRKKFKTARWILYDTPNDIAEDRIAKRQGHFYKGAPAGHKKERRGEWEFEKIHFNHQRIDGTKELQGNADLLAAFVRENLNEQAPDDHR